LDGRETDYEIIHGKNDFPIKMVSWISTIGRTRRTFELKTRTTRRRAELSLQKSSVFFTTSATFFQVFRFGKRE
jgi:hypothetical protein